MKKLKSAINHAFIGNISYKISTNMHFNGGNTKSY